MSDKLGYTFYPKDFISDPDVMMMTPNERGIYRDLIDLAYMNDNVIKYTLVQLAKYTNSTEKEVEDILNKKAVKIKDYWSIPSCDKRIKKANANRENGAKGGRPKKPKQNPTKNPEQNPNKTQDKRQREIERENEIENKRKEIESSTIWLEQVAKKHSITKFKEALKDFLDEQELILGDNVGMNRNINDIKNHFNNWVRLNKNKYIELTFGQKLMGR